MRRLAADREAVRADFSGHPYVTAQPLGPAPAEVLLRATLDAWVYLGERESPRLVELARAEGRSRAEIIREAITAYVPTATGDGDFALAAGFPRRDDDLRPISEIPEDELLDGLGQ